jgi:RNA polymerase sigma-70 factor, ECF subfamily
MEAYARYGHALLRKARRMLGNTEDAKDIVQGLFADLYDKDEPAQELPYLYRAVTNRCLSFMRDETNRKRLLEENAPPPAVRASSDEETVGYDLLAKLVRALDSEDCEVLVCRYVDDMTQEEIAELLGLSRKTIGKRLDRIRVTIARLGQISQGDAS